MIMRKHLAISDIILGSLLCVLTTFCGCGGGVSNLYSTSIAGCSSSGLTVGSGQGNVGQTVGISVRLDTSIPIRAAVCTVAYDSSLLSPGDLGSVSIRDDGATLGSGLTSRRKWSASGVTLLFVRGNSATGPIMATIPFRIIGEGIATLAINHVTAYDANGHQLTVQGEQHDNQTK